MSSCRSGSIQTRQSAHALFWICYRGISTHFCLCDPFHLHIFDVLGPHHFLLLLSHQLLFVLFGCMNSVLSSWHSVLHRCSTISWSSWLVFVLLCWRMLHRSHLQLGADHVIVKLIWVLIQSFLPESCKRVLFLVVVTGKHQDKQNRLLFISFSVCQS